ncbi:MAG: undecaprenyldiphospho-muramoylpentapeptide beta-N-acetylglucosaminyltransferase [Desulfobacterales bacterium]|nr:undecaprenyldiphospho-muramoylpentapeptide beta-N-acetylglucosaminyltransferase [Desulfobacterales bacterium]MCP4160352.1 undecaprenyldiphospho-muramoylpentapeptide beta-N-acetylglucosaminyltransferase [Deltaproteobacteria bacterium]
MNKRSLNIMLTGGGTGGHLFPGIAIAQTFMKVDSNNEIMFAGTGKEFEIRIVKNEGFQYKVVKSEGIKGFGLFGKLKSLGMIPLGVLKAISIIRKFNPDIVIGLGGYSSAPFAIGAFILRKKIVLCEQNAIPGITTRALSKIAKRIYVTFENTKLKVKKEKLVLTGNPVRSEMKISKNTDEEDGLFTVFITGGSQGAHSINMAMKDSLKILSKIENIKIIHQTGANDEKELQSAYMAHNIESDVSAFFNNMHEHYENADLIISRAGATTIAELTIMGKASIYVPYPYAADNHQEHNAMSLVRKNAGLLMKNSELSGEFIAEKISYFIKNRDEINKMGENALKLGKPNAASDIVEDCYKVLGV